MLNRKLLEVLQRLDPAEHKRLRLYLQSTYANQRRHPDHLLRLYDYIMRHGAGEHHPELAKATVFSLFFPGRPFQEKQKGLLDMLASDLFGLVRQFLAQSLLEADMEQYEALALLRFYRRHALEERFQQTLEVVRKKQERNTVHDARYYMAQFSIEEEVFQFQSLFNSYEGDANLLAVHQNLDMYYSITKLEYACALNYQHKLSKLEDTLDSTMIQAILGLSQQKEHEDSPLIDIYSLLLTLIQQPDHESAFSRFEGLLDKHQMAIPGDKFSDLKAYYRYFWGRRYFKSGDEYSRRRMFEIYKEHFEQGYFYVNGNINVHALRVLIMFALKSGQFDWAKHVLDTHPPERICGTRYATEFHNLNVAEYFFSIKEYDEALNKLTYCLFENPHFSILADVLLIKVYFETRNELLDFRIKALTQKIRRSSLRNEHKVPHINFVKNLNKVIKYTWEKSNSNRQKIKAEIAGIPDIIQREWLLEKLGG